MSQSQLCCSTDPSSSPDTHSHQRTKPGYQLRTVIRDQPDGPSNRYRYRCRYCTDAQPTNKIGSRDNLMYGPAGHKGYRCHCDQSAPESQGERTIGLTDHPAGVLDDEVVACGSFSDDQSDRNGPEASDLNSN